MDIFDFLFIQKMTEKEQYKKQSELYESVLTGTVTEFTVPETWTKIRAGTFRDCTKLKSVTFNNNITKIGNNAFQMCWSLESVSIPDSVTAILDWAFSDCIKLSTLYIPSNVTSSFGSYTFYGCSALEFVTLGSDFNANGLNLSSSTLYSVETLAAMLEALADRTNETTAYTLKLGSENLAKLTDEQKAIATDKNWTLA